MTADKRTPHTDALDTLGTAPLDDTAKRDAIHLAVEPLIAGEQLWAGHDVQLNSEGLAFHAPSNTGRAVGIVDPFLIDMVEKGQRFWCVLYPRTIKSLRHVWSHPSFKDEPGVPAEEPVGSKPDAKAKAETWLRDFCLQADCPSFDTLLPMMRDIAERGEHNDGESTHSIDDYGDSDTYLTFRDRNAHGDIPDEFWDHWETLLDVKFKHRAKHFTCSC